jgi:rhodanese-related sulfurtransferase
VARELQERGFKNVHPLYGGFDAWVDNGGAVEPK